MSFFEKEELEFLLKNKLIKWNHENLENYTLTYFRIKGLNFIK